MSWTRDPLVSSVPGTRICLQFLGLSPQKLQTYPRLARSRITAARGSGWVRRFDPQPARRPPGLMWDLGNTPLVPRVPHRTQPVRPVDGLERQPTGRLTPGCRTQELPGSGYGLAEGP